jgi:predicted naringenin-chalcone synthase
MHLQRIAELVSALKGTDDILEYEARNEMFREFAPPLAVEAAGKAIKMWGGSKDDITHILGVTCTGTIVPGVEFHVIQGLGLKASTQRVSISLMGCFGGCTELKVASAIAAQNPSHRVLVVCCELCSLQGQVQKIDMDQLVSSKPRCQCAG